MEALATRIERMSIPEPTTGCWLWLGFVHRTGYARMSVDRRTVFSHRAAFVAFHGPIPVGKIVMHRCDQRSCVNPAHLVAGTLSDNSRDCERKGRRPRRGERNPNWKGGISFDHAAYQREWRRRNA